MSLENAIDNLQSAFDAVADQIQEKYPAVWEKALTLYTNEEKGVVDTDSAVRFLIEENYAGWDGKPLVQVADEHGEEAVINYIEAVNAGIYI